MIPNQGIAFRHVSKSYPIGRQSVTVFEDVTLDIPAGDFVAIMGPSGSGKSTILNLTGGIDRPDKGEVSVGGDRLDRLGEAALTRWRAANVGFVFQFYNLMPMLSAEQNVELPLLLLPLSGLERRRRVETVLDLVGLTERRKHLPSELSGGQQQRVGIARAIAKDPKFLLCDEPTGDLDRAAADDVVGILTLLNTEMAKTIVIVTHDEAVASAAQHSLSLDKGRFISRGPIAARPELVTCP